MKILLNQSDLHSHCYNRFKRNDFRWAEFQVELLFIQMGFIIR